MDLNAGAEANGRMFNLVFIGQQAQERRRRLQKVDGDRGMSLSGMREKEKSNRIERSCKHLCWQQQEMAIIVEGKVGVEVESEGDEAEGRREEVHKT